MALMLLPFAVGTAAHAMVFAFVRSSLPDPVAVHWDFKGNADGTTTSPLGLLGLSEGVFAMEAVVFMAAWLPVRSGRGVLPGVFTLAWAIAGFTCAFSLTSLLAHAGHDHYTEAEFPTAAHWLIAAAVTAAAGGLGHLLSRAATAPESR
ncbi:DUF1648 domain-containing protein [Streptomyces sp. NPDC127105]|uniref:DUF1648 domain-containing protein n=1 Tax=Streptomyces sp. NPDC127105 TaxID=3345359 RepID=UPI003661271D